MLMEKVLLATDFSEPARELLTCLPELKMLGVKEVILCHAISVVRAQASAIELQRYNEEQLNLQKKSLEEEGFKVTVRVPLGFPPEEIINTATLENASLILMGSHGGGMIKSFFLGSTTFDVIRMSTIPVLIEKYANIKTKDFTPACHVKFNRVLFPTDFSSCAQHVWEEIKKIAVHLDEIVIVSVLERIRDKEAWNETREQAEQTLAMMKKEMEEAGCQAKVYLSEGTPSRRILEFADKEAASLIMMPKRGEGFIKQLLLGSTAEAVARQSKQPVLLVPCPES